MTRRVVLLRHAAPEARPEQSPSAWPLTPDGRKAAGRIGDRLPEDAVLVSSPELKAIQTLMAAAGVAADTVAADGRFAEISRPGEPFDGDHRRRRLAWVTGVLDRRHATWETPASAAERFQAGLNAYPGDVVVVASHGMVMTAWLCSIGRVGPGEPAGEFWRGLRFPDVVSVEID